MLKLLGAMLILAAATLAGYQRAAQYADRPRQIRGLIGALQRLETEIQYGYTPLPDALKRIASQSREPLRRLLAEAAAQMEPPQERTAEEAVGAALEKHWGGTSMKAAEREAVRQLSCSLGTSSRQDQVNHILLAVQQLKQEEAAAREDQVKYERMSKNLGLLLGALIVILIL